MSRFFKTNSDGFTLVEVIVVAVIVAALAATAIPLYLNHVNDSRNSAAANAAGSVASFCGACENVGGAIADQNIAGGGVVNCDVNPSTIQVPADVTIVIDGAANTVTGNHVDGGVAQVASW